MNPQEMISIKNDIKNLGISIEGIKKIVASLKIDRQRILKSNSPIPPGKSCKVAYDSNGLILKNENLEIDDIPELPIEKIIGLKKILDSKFKSEDISTKSNISHNEVKQKDIKPGSGIKADYDKNGSMFLSSDLSQVHIPELPIEKIIGLGDKLSFLESQICVSNETIKEKQISPGTYPKITYNSNGQVLSGTKLSIDDIPIEFINKINLLESQIPKLASQQSVDSLLEDVKNKVISNTPIIAGTYPKIKFDKNGLVLSGGNLTINDLPEIQIENISNLESTLRKKADQSDLIQLNNIVSSISNNINQYSELLGLKKELGIKADNKDVEEINSKVRIIQGSIETLFSRIPTERITEQLQQIQNTLSTLSGRITVIENRMNMDEKFCKIP